MDYNDIEDKFFFRVMRVRDKLSELQEFKEEYASKRDKYPKWRQRNGKLIPVYAMKTGHIRCCINLLKRCKDDPASEQWIELFKAELQYRYILQLEQEDERNTEIIAIL